MSKEPKIAAGAFVIASVRGEGERNDLSKSHRIERAMSAAIQACLDVGELDPVKQREAMMEAREAVKAEMAQEAEAGRLAAIEAAAKG